MSIKSTGRARALVLVKRCMIRDWTLCDQLLDLDTGFIKDFHCENRRTSNLMIVVP